MNIADVALYAICINDDTSLIKIGKITGGVTTLLNQYSTRYNPQGYKLLRYWNGDEYYQIEKEVLNHELLLPFRIKNNTTGRLTEWFNTSLDIIDNVVHIIISHHRSIKANSNQLSLKIIQSQPPVIVYDISEKVNNIDNNENLSPYHHFISELCLLGNDKYIISARLYEYYNAYYNGKGDSNKLFVKQMSKHFPRKRRGYGGAYCYIGIDINPEKIQDIKPSHMIYLT